MRFFLLLLVFTLVLPFLFCINKEKKDTKNILLIGGLLYLNSQAKTGSVDYDCNTSPSPKSFAEFKTAIDTLNTSSFKCSECHGVNTAQSNFIITNYSSVGERVIVSNPNASVLYFKVKVGGSMNAYSNSKVNQAIYCWITNGASP